MHVSVCVWWLHSPNRGGQASDSDSDSNKEAQKGSEGDGGKAWNKPSTQQPENGRASPGAKGEKKKPEKRGAYS